MRPLFGMVALLLVLAIGGIVAVRQLRTIGAPVMARAASGASQASVAGSPRQIEQQVRDDVAKALQQGADAHRDAEDK